MLLDTIGELASVYSLAAVAFVGGSLVPAGGHNPLEPAQFGVPIVMGPHYANFRAITDDLRRPRCAPHRRAKKNLPKRLDATCCAIRLKPQPWASAPGRSSISRPARRRAALRRCKRCCHRGPVPTMSVDPLRKAVASGSASIVGLGLRAGLRSNLARGTEPIRRLRYPVISIGNLSTGGSGKTPLTIALAKPQTARLPCGRASRGYGRDEQHAGPRSSRRNRGRVRRRAAADRARDRRACLRGRAALRGRPAGRIETLQDDAPGQNNAKAAVVPTSWTTASSIANSIATSTFCCSNREDWHDTLLPAGNLREPLSAPARATSSPSRPTIRTSKQN